MGSRALAQTSAKRAERTEFRDMAKILLKGLRGRDSMDRARPRVEAL
jgi:hypothetical protein